MVVAKIDNIKILDCSVTFIYYEEDKIIGSRNVEAPKDQETGKCELEDYLKTLSLFDFLSLKEQGITVPEQITEENTILEKLAYQGYKEYLEAKQTEEQEKEQIIE